MARINHKQRRGLSSVVGAVFMVLVMIGALNAVLLTMRQQDTVTQAVIDKSNSSLDKLNEEIRISDIRVSSGKLNMTVSNIGGAAATLKSLYLVNETASPKTQYRYDLDTVVDGRKSVSIGQSSPAIGIKNDVNYSVKVVTESGNSISSKISSLSKVALQMSLIVIPPTVAPQQNVTLLFAVTNNLTDSDLPAQVTPTLTKTLSCGASTSSCQFIDYGVAPTSAYISKGSTALFKWVYGVRGPDAATMTFNASLTNAKQGNYVIEKGKVQIIKESQISLTSDSVIGNSLLAKPEVFILAPGPFGDSNDKGYWGIVVANPVNIKMNITQVTINMFSTNMDSSHKPLTSSGCAIAGVKPSTGWTCPHDGTLRWEGLASPVTIKPYGVYTFLAKAKPGGINSPEPALLLSVTAFTSLGQFAKQGYATNMFQTPPAPLMNVYLTDTSTAATAIQESHILGNMTMLSAENNKRIYVAVTDFDTDSDSASRLLAGATLIINVPKNFTNIAIPNPLPQGFNYTTQTLYSDGTTQIRATISEAIGDVSGVEGKVFYFDATAPTVFAPKTYVMHTFLEGRINTSPQFEADSFGTFGLLVCPTAACT
jgi:hypothetical protein